MKSLVFSHIGKRKQNQDYILVQNLNSNSYLFLVSDGMGGYEHGDIAAKNVAESIHTFLSTIDEVTPDHIQKAVNKANLVVRQLREKLNSKIGSTIGGVIISDNRAFCFWVGDVKVFHYRDNKLQNESTSHTLMNEVIKNGSINNPSQTSKYKHVVTRSVQGDLDYSQIEFFEIKDISSKDLFIVCSDGVHDIFDAIHIQQLLNTSDTVEEALNRLEKRLLQDASDNASLIAARKN